jgi:hypothetical protein
VKRLVSAAAAILALLLLPAGAGATGGETEVEPASGNFEMTWEDCKHLPQGTELIGTGTGTSVTRTTTHRGITTIENTTIIPGTATDEADNRYRYRFLYTNHFRVSNTKTRPTIYSGLMEDLFLLHGRGPARLSNGFVAVYTTDFADLARYDPIHQFGDPITFPYGDGPFCDPL